MATDVTETKFSPLLFLASAACVAATVWLLLRVRLRWLLPEDAAAAVGPPFMIVAGAAPMSPGQTAWPVLDLEAGEHFTICYLPDPATGAPHFALGMIMPLAVG